MARRKKAARRKKPIEQYDHHDKKRANNPPVGLVTPQTDPETNAKAEYAYDPHLDPQLAWAGKAEQMSFDVPTVSLHVHERIDPKTIIEAVRARNGAGDAKSGGQMPLFETPEENPPLRDAIDFYKHEHGWTNRLIAGDSLLVMNSLLEKEGMAGKVQMVYIDPPYGIKYGSNFQPFVNNRQVTDKRDDDLTQEPETLKAFRDTWELGIHSYLRYMRDRLLLVRDLLSETGVCFVQISDENVHLIRCLMDEVFGVPNYLGQIGFRKTGAQSTLGIPSTFDYIVAYARWKEGAKLRPVYIKKVPGGDGARQYTWLESPDGRSHRQMSQEELANPSIVPKGWVVFRPGPLSSPGYQEESSKPLRINGQTFSPGANRHWSIGIEDTRRLVAIGRTMVIGNTLCSKLYLDDYPISPMGNYWYDTVGTGFGEKQVYVVQTATSAVARCIVMATDPGDLVFDPTCGSGTTAFVAERLGRRWITCDTSRVAATLAKQRLMTASYDYYTLAHPQEGVSSGFIYETVPHVTLKGIVTNPEIKPGASRVEVDAAITKYAHRIPLYDSPAADSAKARVTGPFTVEAVPSATVKPVDRVEDVPVSDGSIARSGATLRHTEWRDELLKTGVRGRGGQKITFTRVEPLAGTRHLHAEAETREDQPKRVAISFGPEHAPLEQRQVEQAWEEARTLNPRPEILLFAAFQFDPEAAKDIDELTPAKTGMVFLKSQMNTDLLTDDLKKKRSSNESFWLIGQPDVELRPVRKGEHKGKWQVEVLGFDYYNTRKGMIESGDTSKTAMWMLDTDYDGRSLYPRQVFFPMASTNEGWAKLARNLKAEIDQERIEAYRGTVSLPFEAGDHRRVAVKIVDDRGIESLKILEIE
jgi:adenine-specific DNA-methyltransferase